MARMFSFLLLMCGAEALNIAHQKREGNENVPSSFLCDLGFKPIDRLRLKRKIGSQVSAEAPQERSLSIGLLKKSGERII